MKRETYLPVISGDCGTSLFPRKQKELNTAFRYAPGALLAENAGASKGKAIPPQAADIAGHCGLRDLTAGHAEKRSAANRAHGYVERLARTQTACRPAAHTGALPPCSRRFRQIHRSVFGPAAGFAPKELHAGNGVWRVEYDGCPYHDTCAGNPAAGCAAAFATATTSTIPGCIRRSSFWHRTKTLGRGNDRCDFA